MAVEAGAFGLQAIRGGMPADRLAEVVADRVHLVTWHFEEVHAGLDAPGAREAGALQCRVVERGFERRAGDAHDGELRIGHVVDAGERVVDDLAVLAEERDPTLEALIPRKGNERRGRLGGGLDVHGLTPSC